MIVVEEWVKESSKEERSKHLKLNEPCIERGGNSTVHRGVLAQFLDTNMPSKVDLCHACNNAKCSNPMHLYWGTRKENVEDAQKVGTWKSPFSRMIEKYGYEEACKMNSNPGNTFGKGNKGKPKSEEHKRKISESLSNR